jgi:RalA-binding protein 1
MHSESSPRAIPSIDAAIQIDSPPHSPREFSRGIYRGLVSDDHPDLLLPPNALPSIEVRVSSSRLRPSRNSYLGLKPSDEEPVFTLSVFSRSDKSELWRVEKVIMALPQLDSQLRAFSDLPLKLPERSIFSGHSPAKVDARRAALNAYFDTLLDIPLDELAALVICRFLTSDAIEPRDDETSLLKSSGKVSPEILRGPDGKPRKEGYLTKKGKNFGGWKARYFVLHGPELKYFESPGGPHLGTIRVQNAQIGKQSPNGPNPSPSRNDDDSDNQFRHAILILEPKRKDSSALVRHVLCAESDAERDAWIESLLQYVENQTSEEERSSLRKPPGQTQGRQIPNTSAKTRLFASGHKRNNNNNKGAESPDTDPPDAIQTFSYDNAVAAEPPVYGPVYEPDTAKAPGRSGSQSENVTTSGSSEYGLSAPHGSKTISGPTNGTVIQDAGTWGNKLTGGGGKKRSLWSFRARSSSDLASQTQGSYDSLAHINNHNTSTERGDYIRAVFGLPLGEAVQFCPPLGVDVDLPAVVYPVLNIFALRGLHSRKGSSGSVARILSSKHLKNDSTPRETSTFWRVITTMMFMLLPRYSNNIYASYQPRC